MPGRDNMVAVIWTTRTGGVFNCSIAVQLNEQLPKAVVLFNCSPFRGQLNDLPYAPNMQQ